MAKRGLSYLSVGAGWRRIGVEPELAWAILDAVRAPGLAKVVVDQAAQPIAACSPTVDPVP